MVRKSKLCVSFQSLVIGKDRLHRRITNDKLVSGREFYTIPWCILVSFLETFIEIACHFYDFIKWFLTCHCISVYCIEMLQRYWNIYWYEDSWFSVEEMVHGVVAL